MDELSGVNLEKTIALLENENQPKSFADFFQTIEKLGRMNRLNRDNYLELLDSLIRYRDKYKGNVRNMFDNVLETLRDFDINLFKSGNISFKDISDQVNNEFPNTFFGPANLELFFLAHGVLGSKKGKDLTLEEVKKNYQSQLDNMLKTHPLPNHPRELSRKSFESALLLGWFNPRQPIQNKWV